MCRRHVSPAINVRRRDDRVPITPIPRGDVPFDCLVVDCLGPLFSNQKVEYNMHWFCVIPDIHLLCHYVHLRQKVCAMLYCRFFS